MKKIGVIKSNAIIRQIQGFGYNYSKQRIIWDSKTCAWNWIIIKWGIRNSDKLQRFPIRNMSNNCKRSLIFGLGLWYFQLTYHRKKSFNQNRKLLFRKKLWKVYQLIS